MVDDFMSNGEPGAFQHNIDIINVEFPSSITIRKKFFPKNPT
jgi:hypothetical protein